jgi:hypothetical protein
MTSKNSIALSSGTEEGVVLLALQSALASYLYNGNLRVKTRRKNWSSS